MWAREAGRVKEDRNNDVTCFGEWWEKHLSTYEANYLFLW